MARRMGDIRVKICGLKEPRHVAAAVVAGASYIGFNFFAKSPRALSVAQAARLAATVPAGVSRVALTVDADDAALDEIYEAVPLDMLQLHGAESPDRAAELRARFGLPVMKAVGVADASDVAALQDYERVADVVLVDAKPPTESSLPGGNGLIFDWRLIAGRRWRVPWLLAGGLTAVNVAEAVRLTGASQVDVSSGVESAPGLKDAAKIGAFIAAARHP